MFFGRSFHFRLKFQKNLREHEMAALAVYMASPASNFMVGHEVVLDGGLSLVNP